MSTMNMHDALYHFCDQMELVLDEHYPKKGETWQTNTIGQLEERLIEEFDEWKKSNSPLQSAEELIDVANFCMFLYHRYVDEWAEKVGKIFDKRV